MMRDKRPERHLLFTAKALSELNMSVALLRWGSELITVNGNMSKVPPTLG